MTSKLLHDKLKRYDLGGPVMNTNEIEKDQFTEELVDGDTLIEELKAETQLLDDADDKKQEPVQDNETTQSIQQQNNKKTNDALKVVKEKASVLKNKTAAAGKGLLEKKEAWSKNREASGKKPVVSVEQLKEKGGAVVKKVHTQMKEKKAEKDEFKPEKVVLAPGEIKKYKLFFVSDMEEEANYLHEMSLKGMHFVKKAGIQYVFQTGESKNYFYHLGYYEKDKREGSRYETNYKDAGWDKIYSEKGEFDGMWNYFRTEVKEDEVEPHIFSDRVSRVALYSRLLSSWRSLLAMMIACLLCMGVFLFFLNSKTGRVDSIFLIISITISIIILLIFAVYSRVYLKINRKLVELKQ